MKTPGMYFAAAPVWSQAKSLFWRDLKKMTPPWFLASRPSESELMIPFKNGI